MAELKCTVDGCDRVFTYPQNLGRHLTAAHGFTGKSAQKKVEKEKGKTEKNNEQPKKEKKSKKRVKKSTKALKKSKRRTKALDLCINGATFSDALTQVRSGLDVLEELFKSKDTEAKIYQRDYEKIKEELGKFQAFAASVASKTESVIEKLNK